MKIFLAALLLVLTGCNAITHADYISIPELNPAECGCPDGYTRIKITIDHGASLCTAPDMEMSGDIWPVCKSDASVKDTGCKVIEGETVKCP
jgi:hypothetical protein